MTLKKHETMVAICEMSYYTSKPTFTVGFQADNAYTCVNKHTSTVSLRWRYSYVSALALITQCIIWLK